MVLGQHESRSTALRLALRCRWGHRGHRGRGLGGTAYGAALSPYPCSERCGGAYAALLDVMKAKLGREEEDGARGGEWRWGAGGAGEVMGRMLGGYTRVLGDIGGCREDAEGMQERYQEDAGGMHEDAGGYRGMQRGCRRGTRRMLGGCREDDGDIGGCTEGAGRMLGSPGPQHTPVAHTVGGTCLNAACPLPRSRGGAVTPRMWVQPHSDARAAAPRASGGGQAGERGQRLPGAAEVPGTWGVTPAEPSPRWHRAHPRCVPVPPAPRRPPPWRRGPFASTFAGCVRSRRPCWRPCATPRCQSRHSPR